VELKAGWALPLLAIVPVLGFLYWRAQRARPSLARRYATPALVAAAIGAGPGLWRHIPPALYLASLTLLLFAVARPQGVVSVPSEEGTIVLALDVSGSMRAIDVQPSRIDAAKSAAIEFVERQRANGRVRIGIVSFSDAAFIVQPPTTDRDAAISAIARLQPQRGTGIGRGILAALDALVSDPLADLPSEEFGAQGTVPDGPLLRPGTRSYAAATIVLLTDGVNTAPPTPLSVLDLATRRGVRIYAIGLGTPAGGQMGGIGRPQVARFDRETLVKVTEATDGEFFDASSAEDLSRIYKGLVTELVVRQERTELSAYVTGLAALLAFVGAGISLWRFNRLP